MNATHWRRVSVILAGSLLLPMLGVRAQDAGEADKAKLEKTFPGKPNYSPALNRNFPTRPLFGDTHLHTAVSLDAGTAGARLNSCRRLPPGPGRAYHILVRPAGATDAAA